MPPGSNPKVTAGILSSVLAVSLVIAILCTSLIMLAYYYRVATLQHTISDHLRDNARSGMNILLATSDASVYANGYWKDLFGRGEDSVWLRTKQWGLHQVGVALAKQGTRTEQTVALLGHGLNELGHSALYLADEQRPLSVAGNTLLKGTCYLPKAGIKSAYVNRVGYQGTQLVHGTTQESQPNLPELSSAIISQLTQPTAEENHQPLLSLPDSAAHSFVQPPLYYHSPNAVTLNGTLAGNIIVASDQAVLISRHANLENIIVVAPYIEIDSDFQGRLQAVATDSLWLGKQAYLQYPSSLVLLTEQGGEMTLQPASRIDGTVVVTGKAERYYQRLLSIGDASQVTGMVYADGMVELKGSILGHLSCRKFLLRTPSTLYENHILNGTVDPSQRSEHYLASSLWGATTKKGIAQWLY